MEYIFLKIFTEAVWLRTLYWLQFHLGIVEIWTLFHGQQDRFQIEFQTDNMWGVQIRNFLSDLRHEWVTPLLIVGRMCL